MGAQRSIVHLDADAFFASVEQAADVRLRGKPIAVGGEKRGVVASASYEARGFGIYTPMPTALARRLCPKLIILPGDFEKYELFSRLMFSYAYDFTPDVEIGSIDEGYLDLTGARKPAVHIAQTIRETIRQALKLPVSEGIGSNKLISQIASKLRKPCAFEFVPHGCESEFLDPLANKWLPGIGPKAATQLNAAGLARIGQIARTPPELLGLVVGGNAFELRNFARGIDERPVIPVRAPAKSYSEQETFESDTTDEEFLEATLKRMADKLMAKVRAGNKSIRTVTVKVRYNDMDEARAAESLPEPTDLESDIYSLTSELLRKAWQRRVSLRLVSLRLSNVYEGSYGGELALDTVSSEHEARQRLAATLDELRQKFGRAAVFHGHDFVLREKRNRGKEPEAPAPRRCGDTPPYHSPDPRRCGDTPPYRLSGSRLREAPVIPLNVHSYYSFLDSTLSPKAIVDFAIRHELPAIALTDKNNLHGAVEFAQVATKAGIKPIIGAEVFWQGHRVCLYAENRKGYHRLCAVLNAVEERRGGDTLALPAEALFADTEGLLALSAELSLAEFFPGRFYRTIDDPERLEDIGGVGTHTPYHGGVGTHTPYHGGVGTHSPYLGGVRIHAPYPMAASFPVHYETPADRWKFDFVQSIRTLTLLRQPHPDKRLDGSFHFRSSAEMRQLSGGDPQALALTREIADRCSFQFELGKPQFPNFIPPDGSSPGAFLRRLVLEGLHRRYLKDHIQLRPQVEEELGIITEVGYEEYFLVMWDILQECKLRGIDWITRGSAADSLACYCLGISSVCPIRFDLYFRRFLNKERMAMNKLPDIDVDFPHDRKDDVIDLVFEKYRDQNAAIVGGFSTFQARSAFAEAAKVLGVSDHQVRRVTERLPYFCRAGNLAEAASNSLECRDLPLDQEPYSIALQMAQFLDGFPRYAKMHPCGLVLSRQPMHEITPCFTSAKGYPTTHFDMDSVEAVGLVKMDILAQGGLAVMRDVRQMLTVSEAGPCAPSPPPAAGQPTSNTSSLPATAPRVSLPDDFDALEPWDDPNVWELIAGGSARAVHHIESPAMISLCKMCDVHDIDTLVAIVSVIRPGAANESKKMEFARRYQGLSPVQYPHPSLEPCLRSTYGLVVYEEHILQICECFAGLPAGRADVLRRALGKDKTEAIEEIRTEFAECARRRGRTETDIARVWDLVAGFKGYAFCKAHSTAYGVEAYQSAWLKYYFPAEFMAGVLTNGKGFYQPLVYVLECHRLGIPLLPPDINHPGPRFTVEHGKIHVPVLQVKGLTERTKDRILKEHARGEFASLRDFFLRIQPLAEEMESLIRVGVFDRFGNSRTSQYWDFKALRREAATTPSKARKANAGAASPAARQLWLLPPGDLERLPSVPLVEPDHLERLRWEEELLGYTVSAHPLELYPDIAWNTYCPVNRLGEHMGEEIVTCGLIVEQRIFHQVTGEPMKFITIADHTGIVETELFAKTYKSYGLNTVRYRVLEVTATVEPFENDRGYTLRVLRAGKPRQARTGNC